MTLEREIGEARKEVVTDGYDMSIGELVALYEREELIINPVFQRYFRWDDGRKTRFIESLLLGIPVPPIFVFQTKEGVWELVDGLQRVSTLLEFMGVLKDSKGEPVEPSILDGTNLVPSLAGRSWEKTSGSSSLTQALKLDLRRSRMRVEILKRESDPTSKFELFQRLNTGGAILSEQEVRNCTMVMINPVFHAWMLDLSGLRSFSRSIRITKTARDKQQDVELVLRFLAFRLVRYKKGLDVHEYLDHAAIRLASDGEYSQSVEQEIFGHTFEFIHRAIGDGAFRRWNGSSFAGKFLMSVFEVLAYGVSQNIPQLRRLGAGRNRFIKRRAKELWDDETFRKYSGAGVRGTDRLANLLPMAKKFLRP